MYKLPRMLLGFCFDFETGSHGAPEWSELPMQSRMISKLLTFLLPLPKYQVMGVTGPSG